MSQTKFDTLLAADCYGHAYVADYTYLENLCILLFHVRCRVSPMKRQMKRKQIKQAVPEHPGIILHNDFFIPMNITVEQMSDALGIPRITIQHLLEGKFSITAWVAIRLAKGFNTSPEFWMEQQMYYDLQLASQEVDLNAITVFQGSANQAANV